MVSYDKEHKIIIPDADDLRKQLLHEVHEIHTVGIAESLKLSGYCKRVITGQT